MQVFSEAHNPNVTNRSMGAECHLVMFYAPWCPFSAQAAPHFNGLARAFPDIGLYAVDSSKSQVGFQGTTLQSVMNAELSLHGF